MCKTRERKSKFMRLSKILDVIIKQGVIQGQSATIENRIRHIIDTSLHTHKTTFSKSKNNKS
jgi:hypothetical protein